MTTADICRDATGQARGAAPTSADVAAILSDHLASLSYPTLLLNGPLARLLWTNGAADRLLAQGRTLVRSGWRVVPASPELQGKFDACLHAPESACWVLNFPSEPSPVILRKDVVRTRSGLQPILLTLYTSEHRAAFSQPDVAEHWGLTPAENRVLRLLCSGYSAERITGSIGITIETARTHIRRIYAKMAVTCREELLYAMSQFRVP